MSSFTDGTILQSEIQALLNYLNERKLTPVDIVTVCEMVKAEVILNIATNIKK